MAGTTGRQGRYLYYLAMAPGRQRAGVGTALMRPVLQACDEQGAAAYLEATTERAVCPMWRQPMS